MNKIIKKTFETIPSAEVLVRKFYAHSKKRVKKVKKTNNDYSKDKNLVENYLDASIKEGDVIIAHFRMSALKKFGYTPHSIIDSLLKRIGLTGTLFIPVMPSYKEINAIKNFDGNCNCILDYNNRTTPSWTGVVGDIFVKDFGAIRSNTPYCTLAGLGSFTSVAFANELDSDYIFGQQSPWFKIMDFGAKILFLGAESYDSITEAHLVEDSFDGFNVKNWFLEADFIINGSIEKKYYIRRPFWSCYLTEFYNIKQLKKHDLINVEMINDVEFSLIPSFRKLYRYYCEEMAKKRNPLFKIPKRFMKG